MTGNNNILFISHELILGGAERQFVELVKGLNIELFTPTVVIIIGNEILEPTKHLENELVDRKIKVLHIQKKWRWDLSVLPKLSKIILQENIQLINFWGIPEGVYSLIIGKIRKIPMVNSLIRDVNPTKSYRSLIKRTIIKYSKIIVSNSKAGLKNYSVPENKGFVIYNGIDLTRFSSSSDNKYIRDQLRIQDSEKVIGIVANLRRSKDYYTFFQAARIIASNVFNVKFVIIGDGDLRNIYLDYANNLGLSDNLIFLGSQENVNQYIKIFDVGVLSSFPERGEGVSNSILEYMAMSKPVVATDVGATGEVIIDGETGFLVPAKDSTKMAEKITQLLKDEQLAINMGNRGRNLVETKFAYQNMVQNFEDIFLRIITISGKSIS